MCFFYLVHIAIQRESVRLRDMAELNYIWFLSVWKPLSAPLGSKFLCPMLLDYFTDCLNICIYLLDDSRDVFSRKAFNELATELDMW